MINYTKIKIENLNLNDETTHINTFLRTLHFNKHINYEVEIVIPNDIYLEYLNEYKPFIIQHFEIRMENLEI